MGAVAWTAKVRHAIVGTQSSAPCPLLAPGATVQFGHPYKLPRAYKGLELRVYVRTRVHACMLVRSYVSYAGGSARLPLRDLFTCL